MRILFHIFFNILNGVNNSGMVAVVKLCADLLQRELCDLTNHVNCHLTRVGNRVGTDRPFNVVRVDAIGAPDFADDPFDGHRYRLGVGPWP